VAPTVRLLGTSTELGWNSTSKHPSTITLNKDIDTPAYSQMIRDPKIANSICSLTTITMAMNRMGENLLLEETAYYDYDGFDKWVFSSALAGCYGYKSYSVFTDIDGLKKKIAKGYPAAVSVKYTNDPTNTRYHYVKGAPGTIPGHLILVRGLRRLTVRTMSLSTIHSHHPMIQLFENIRSISSKKHGQTVSLILFMTRKKVQGTPQRNVCVRLRC